jgi:hypothetical protein
VRDARGVKALAEDLAQQAMGPTEQQAAVAVTYLLSLFQSLAAEYAAASPSFDVLEFLRRQALEDADGDSPA